MNTQTVVQILPRERAEQVRAMLRQVQNDPGRGLALDEQGRVAGVVPINSPEVRRVLGDFDVHA